MKIRFLIYTVLLELVLIQCDTTTVRRRNITMYKKPLHSHHNNHVNASRMINNCANNPSESELREMLADYIVDLVMRGEIYPNFYDENYYTNKGGLLDEDILHNETIIKNTTDLKKKICTRSEQHRSHINPHISICPHHYEERLRPNRFPHLIEQARCNCEYCLFGSYNETDFECKPVYMPKPVLKRVNCTWIPSYEKVPISCTCIDPSTLAH